MSDPYDVVLLPSRGPTGLPGRITQCNRPDAAQGFRKPPFPQKSLAFFSVKNLTLPMHPHGAQSERMSGQHHILKNAAPILHKGIRGAIRQNQNHNGCAMVRVRFVPYHFRVQSRYLLPVFGIRDRDNDGRLASAAGRRVSSRFQYGVQHIGWYRFICISLRRDAS